MKSSFKKITPIFFILSSLIIPKPGLTETVAIHSIINFRGKVTVRKPNWKTPQPASVGFTLKSEDTLIIPANASISIYCSNLKTVEFKQQGTHKVSDKCSTGQAVIQLNNSNNTKFRTDTQTEEARGKLPYLITPRETAILIITPQLRWNKVSDATAYTVEIDLWKKQTNETQITYTGEPLQEGERYQVIITTNNGAKEEESVGFTLLDKDTREKVLKEVELIKQQSLSLEEKGIMLAKLYRSYQLYSDAIEVLEELVKQGSQQIIVYQLLGDTYLKTELPQLAKKPYQKALDLAKDHNNIAVQAEIKIGLGITYNNLGDREKAVQLLKEAKEFYTDLGDETMTQNLNNIISQIREE